MRFEKLKSPVGNTWFIHTWHIDGTTFVVGGLGSGGQVLRSEDDGDHWRVTKWKRTTGHGAWADVMDADKQHGLRQVWGPTKEELFVVGEYGTVLHSEDGGETFLRLKHPKGDCLFGCVGYRDKLFVSGDTGIRRKSGERWLMIDDSASKDLARLYVAGEALFCVGDKATVLRSDDGKKFRRMPLRANTDLYSFASVDGAQRIIVGGTGGGLAASNDGGELWETMTTKDKVRWTGMVVIAPGVSDKRVGDGVRVLALGEKGKIVVSEDAGYSWSPLKTPVETELWSGVVTKSGNLLIVGRDGTILRAPL